MKIHFAALFPSTTLDFVSAIASLGSQLVSIINFQHFPPPITPLARVRERFCFRGRLRLCNYRTNAFSRKSIYRAIISAPFGSFHRKEKRALMDNLITDKWIEAAREVLRNYKAPVESRKTINRTIISNSLREFNVKF